MSAEVQDWMRNPLALFEVRGKVAVVTGAQVTKIRRILEELGDEIASPDEARRRLALKGADQVAF
jgi:uncharacterized protein (DUF849 family)